MAKLEETTMEEFWAKWKNGYEYWATEKDAHGLMMKDIDKIED